MNERCELSDLLVDQCACRLHAPRPERTPYTILAWFPAHFDSHCEECDRSMFRGERIALTEDHEYICGRCARDEAPPFEEVMPDDQ